MTDDAHDIDPAWRDLPDLLAQLPTRMAEDLKEQDPTFARELAVAYLDADPATQADMAAFFTSGGPKMVHDLKVEHEDGTPTAADLADWPGAP